MRTPRHSPPPPGDAAQARRFSQEERCPAAVRLVSGYLSQMMTATNAATEEEDEQGDDEAVDRIAAMAPSGNLRAAKELQQRASAAEEADSSLSSASAGQRRRRGVDKYVSDSSQLNLQFERRRSAHQYRPQTGGGGGDVLVGHHSPLRYRTSLSGLPSTVGDAPTPGLAMYSAQSYLDSRSASRPSSSGPSLIAGTANHPPGYEISRVRSSPALAAVAPPPPSSTSPGRFPFHYTPHPPTGTPPTLRELDARY